MNTIAKARHQLKPHKSYVVKLTLPVPKGTFNPPTNTLPLAIKDLNGEPLPTNVDVVSFYPNREQDGADVVELQARIHNPQRLRTEVELEIVEMEQPRRRTRIEQDVVRLLRSQTVMLKAEDAFGNTYTGTISELDNYKVTKFGPANVEVLKHVHMKPDELSGPEALDRLLGVHAVWKVWDKDKAVGLDLHVHNGDSGLTDNAPNAPVYFKHLELWVPDSYVLLHKDLDPAVGHVTFEDGYRKYELIKPFTNGKMHVIPQRGAFLRRFVLTPREAARRGRSYLDNQNLAFCKEEAGLWSWWSIGRWSTTAATLPSMSHAEEGARADHAHRYNEMRQSLRTGNAGPWPYSTPALGYAKPWGARHQGMTGGEGITFIDGTLVAQAASVDGYNMWDLQLRMNLDRMPAGIWNEDGKHTELADWVRTGSIGTYLPSRFYHRPPANNDMFGFDDADQSHVNFVSQHGLVPHYQEDLFDFASHDLQHYVRWIRQMRALVWIGNDTIAKLLVSSAGNLAKMSCVPHYNSANGYMQGMNLIRYSELPENLAGMFGRDGGWMMDAVNMHYAIADEPWRQSTKNDWYTHCINTIDHVQVPCNGAIQGNDSVKILDGRYRSAQTNEVSILVNGLYGAITRVFGGVDEELESRVEGIISKAVYGLKDWACEAEDDGPRFQVAVTTLNSQTVFCNFADLPSNGYGNNREYALSWQSWAIGYLCTGDPAFIEKALNVARNTHEWQDWMVTLADYESVASQDNLPGHVLLYQIAQENNF
jgi:hypothetical protein